MSSSRKRVVGFDSVGKPPKKKIGRIETLRFVIYDFKERNEEPIDSRPLLAHGRRWRVECCPRSVGAEEKEYVAIFLNSLEKDVVTVHSTIRCRNRNFGWFATFTPEQSWGHSKFLKRSNIKKYLEEDESLIIEIDIQMAVADAAYSGRVCWYPKKLQRQDILVDLYQDACSKVADVVFSVENNIYHAHKNILSLRCKKLYEIAKECDDDRPIVINSMRGEIFKSVLDFVYTVKTPELKSKDVATELLVAADCYDCVHLKLYVESFIVENFLTLENTAELILFADSYSCALLKEAAINLFVADPEPVKKGVGWSQIKDSNRILTELLNFATASCKTQGDEDLLETMDVAALRNELDEKNLELDGSREVLEKRLKISRQGEEGTKK